MFTVNNVIHLFSNFIIFDDTFDFDFDFIAVVIRGSRIGVNNSDSLFAIIMIIHYTDKNKLNSSAFYYNISFDCCLMQVF
jgi:hypothetical protein